VKLALDTNRYVDLMRGDAEVRALVEGARVVLVPFVVLAELRATTHRYATLYRQLRQQGTPVPTNDLWIAALVTEHGARLCTRDAHFENLAQLDLV